MKVAKSVARVVTKSFARRPHPQLSYTFLIYQAIESTVSLVSRDFSSDGALLEEIGFALLGDSNSKWKQCYI